MVPYLRGYCFAGTRSVGVVFSAPNPWRQPGESLEFHSRGAGEKVLFELAKITTPNIQSMTIEEYTGPKLTMNMSLDSKILEKSVLEI